MNHLPKDHPSVLLAQYKSGDDLESNSIEVFVYWLENEWDSGLTSKNETKRIEMVKKIIDQYLDIKRPMDKIHLVEQQQLLDWIKAVKGE